MFIYAADTYCDSCGRRIREQLTTEGFAPDDPDDEYSYDSDNFPKGPLPEEETDSPDHCAAAGECLEAISLYDYGLTKDAELFGAETVTVGALLSDGLTEHGTEYLREMLSEPSRTPYQEALHRFWKAVFADELS